MTSLSTLVLLLWCSCVANSFRRVLNSQARGAAVSCRQETHSRGLAGHCSSSKEHRAIGATRAAWLGRGTALRAEFRQGSYSLGEDVAAVDALKLLEYSLLEFVGRSLSEELFDRNKIEYRWFSDYLDTFLAERVDGGGSGIGTVGSDEGPWAHSDLLVRDLLSQEVERLLLRKDAESSTGVSMTLSLYIYPSKFAKRIVELKSEAIRELATMAELVVKENSLAESYADVHRLEGEVVAKRSRRSLFGPPEKTRLGSAMEWYSQLFQRWNSYITNIAIKEMLDDIKQTKNEETLKFFSDFVMSIANSETLSLLLLDRKSGGNQDSNRRDSPFNVVLTAGSGSNPPELRSYSAAEAVYAPGSPRHLLERLLVLSHEEDLGRMWPKGQLFPLKKSSSIEDDAIKQLLSGTDYDEDDDQNQLREDSTTSASASSASSESDQEEKIVSEISANAPEDADLLELYVAALNSRSGAVGKTIKSTLDSEQFNIFAAEDSPNNSRTLPRAVFREKEFVVDIRTLGKELLQRRAAVANRMNDTIVSFLRDSYEGNTKGKLLDILKRKNEEIVAVASDLDSGHQSVYALSPLVTEKVISLQKTSAASKSPAYTVNNSSDVYYIHEKTRNGTTIVFGVTGEDDLDSDSEGVSATGPLSGFPDSFGDSEGIVGKMGWRAEDNSQEKADTFGAKKKIPVSIVDPPANRKPPRYGDGGDSRDGDDAESRNPVDFGDIEIGTLDSFLRLGPDAVIRMIGTKEDEDENGIMTKYMCLEARINADQPEQLYRKWVRYEDAVSFMLGATGDGGYQDCSFGEMRPAQSQKNIEEDEQNDDNPFFGGKIVPM